jgi:hypothetical protein
MKELLGARLPELEDKHVLIRLEAAIAETQRLRSVVPVGIPHGTTQVMMITMKKRAQGTVRENSSRAFPAIAIRSEFAISRKRSSREMHTSR